MQTGTQTLLACVKGTFKTLKIVLSIGVFLTGVIVSAQGTSQPPVGNGPDTDPALYGPCFSNENYACTIIAAFDQSQGSYWFVNGSSSDGIPNTPMYLTYNGVNQPTVHTNNTNNPGAITNILPLGTYLVVGAGPNRDSGGRGLCNPSGQNPIGENADAPFVNIDGSYSVYSMGFPYACNQ